MSAGISWHRPAAEAVSERLRLRVLLIEDDPGDAFLVGELLAEVNAPIELSVAESLAEAVPRLDGVDCVLLDLGLPDASGLDALRQILRSTESVAVCVLTGLGDEHLGIAAVGEGAQDYLIKGTVDGVLLSRALRYAVERQRADDNVRRLREIELRQAESARLERGLLPQPLLDGAAVDLVLFYQPGRDRALLGGDFYDAVATTPDRLHLLVGDVCGHGVDEAPLGVALRVAWRALVLAGVPDDAMLEALEQVLVSERRSDELFATVVMVTVDLRAGLAQVRLAGHPPPMALEPGGARPCAAETGLVLGVAGNHLRPVNEVTLTGDTWSLLLYTDGLIEGLTDGDGSAPATRAGADGSTRRGRPRLGLEGLMDLLSAPERASIAFADLPTWLVEKATRLNGGPLSDDVAVLLLAPRRTR